MRLRQAWISVGASVLLALAAGCSHHHVAYAPPPPPVPAENPPVKPTTEPAAPVTSAKPSAATGSDDEYVATHAPIYTQTGMASWYGPPYHNRTGANGTVYNEHHLSAAHRTLPMGSLIRVTNVRTGQSAVMRVTDRGPFVQGRVLDLSLAAAKATGVWGPGVAEVRIDVYSAPKPIDEGGRWCVQIGAFDHQSAALHLEAKLEREYRSANVIEFQGPTGFWVRIRPEHDDRELATAIANSLRPSEGEAWLVRLD
ncbi:MAG TPA: septal ring lytic transglycosylase RlpA family protein [Acidobacteriaceae bacterium]